MRKIGSLLLLMSVTACGVDAPPIDHTVRPAAPVVPNNCMDAVVTKASVRAGGPNDRGEGDVDIAVPAVPIALKVGSSDLEYRWSGDFIISGQHNTNPHGLHREYFPGLNVTVKTYSGPQHKQTTNHNAKQAQYAWKIDGLVNETEYTGDFAAMINAGFTLVPGSVCLSTNVVLKMETNMFPSYNCTVNTLTSCDPANGAADCIANCNSQYEGQPNLYNECLSMCAFIFPPPPPPPPGVGMGDGGPSMDGTVLVSDGGGTPGFDGGVLVHDSGSTPAFDGGMPTSTTTMGLGGDR